MESHSSTPRPYLAIASQPRSSTRSSPAPGNEETRIWAPLVDFSWTGSEKQIAEDTWIRPLSAYGGYEQFAYVIAQEEQERCRGISHWLHIARSARDKVSPP